MTRGARLGIGLVAVTWLVAACATGPTVDPAATPRVACEGIPAERCVAAVASAQRSLPHERLVEIQVTCVSEPCSDAAGTLTTTVTLADGRKLTTEPLSWFDPNASGGGVETPPPDQPGFPALPVVPICKGLAPELCREMASAGSGDDGHGAVISIVVTCKGTCTRQSGEGETTWTYADGTESMSSWGYSSGG